MVARSAGPVFRYVAVYQPSLAGANLGVGLAERCLAFPEGLDLGAYQDQACLELVEQLVVIGGGAVLGDDLDVLLLRLSSPPLSWGRYHSRRA